MSSPPGNFLPASPRDSPKEASTSRDSPSKKNRPRSSSLTAHSEMRFLGNQRKSCYICEKAIVYCPTCNTAFCTQCFEIEHEHPNLVGHVANAQKTVGCVCCVCRDASCIYCAQCSVYYCGACFEIEHEHPSMRGHESVPKFNKWELNWAEVSNLKKIGEGNFGVVYKACWKGKTVAVKKLLSEEISQKAISDFCMEAEAMMQLAYTPHENVVEMLGVCTVEPNICIMMEYCPLGSLDSLLSSRNIVVEKEIMNFARQLADGMAFLHQKGIIHRDLSARNVLVALKPMPQEEAADGAQHVNQSAGKFASAAAAAPQNRGIVLKITDFGMARVQQQHHMHKTAGTLVPWKWAAPECGHFEYCKESDIWSYGVTLVEILRRGDPYPGMAGADVFVSVVREGLQPQIPSNCPSELTPLLKECWKYNPKDRPTFAKIIQKLDTIL